MDYPKEWNKLPKHDRRRKIKELRRQHELGSRKFIQFKNSALTVLIVVTLIAGYMYLTRKTPEQIAFAKSVAAASLDDKVIEFPIEGRAHVSTSAQVEYKTNPPTSGDHYEIPENWGVYTKEIPDGAAVHGLEHGGIWISYTDISDEDIAVLKSIGKENSQSVIVSPRAKDDTKIAVAAWGEVMKLDSVDKVLIQKFINTYKNKGPEALAQ